MPRARSIRVILPLVTTGVLAVVVATFTAVAYRNVRRMQLSVVDARLSSASEQLAVLFATSAVAMLERANILAVDAATSDFLRRADRKSRQRVAVRLRLLRASDAMLKGVELWNGSGRRLLATPEGLDITSSSAARELIARADSAQGAVVGWLSYGADSVSYRVISRVLDGHVVLGYIVQRRRVASTPQASIRIGGLVGPGAKLLLGNVRGDLWTDFYKREPAPLIAWNTQFASGSIVGPSASGARAAFTPIKGTPWAVGVELSANAALAQARTFLQDLIVVDALLVFGAALALIWLSLRLTRPLVELVEAVGRVGDGDYSRRVTAAGDDEFASLGRAFNDMSGRIESAFHDLGTSVTALSASNERYELLFNASPHPKWVYDLATLRFLAVNVAACDLYGYTSEEFLAMTIKEIRPPEDIPRVLESIAHIRDRERIDGQTWRHQRKDGSAIDVEIYSRPLVFDGRAARLVLANDVTERRKLDAALRESEERLRQMAEHIREAFFIVDMATRQALYISPTWAEIWGRPLEQGLDPNVWFQSIHPDDQAAMAMGIQSVARGQPHDLTFRVIRPDGSFRWVHGRSFPVSDNSGRVYRMVGVSRDVTEVKEAEQRLNQAQKMDAIGQLAGGVAHDFNNLLTVILSCGALVLEKTSRDDERHELVREMTGAGEHATTLTRQLLAFSRRQVLAPRLLELNVLVANVGKMLQRLIGEDVSLGVDLARTLPTIRADAGQLEQVLINLAVNARDAMPRGGTLTIRTASVIVEAREAGVPGAPVPGRYVTLTVRDTGTGMDAATQARIFEPFFTTKGAGKGTGLGLATVYGIVHQSGGFITVSSAPGAGTTFTIYLPESDRADPIVEAHSGPHRSLRGTETVLVVEDEEPLRQLMRRILSAAGYTVLIAKDGEQALKLVADHDGQIHLLLSDVVMPAVSGGALAQLIADLRPEIRVLFVSGYTDDAVVRHGVMAADVAFLQKPFTPNMLLHRIRDVLD